MNKRTSLLAAALFAYTFAHAQDWEAGGWLGAAYSFGDINSQYTLKRPNLAVGALLRYNINNRLAFKVSGNLGQTSGEDAFSLDEYQRRRNLSFRSILMDGTAQLEFNFLKYEHGSEDFYTPYLLGGLTLFHYNPKAFYQGSWIELQPLGTEGQYRGSEYLRTQPALAYGAGVKFDVSYEWSMNIEFSARYLFTDYLDDVSTRYPDLDELLENRGTLAVALSDRSTGDLLISEPGRQRGNSQNNDMYAFIGITLAYNFARVRCPWF